MLDDWTKVFEFRRKIDEDNIISQIIEKVKARLQFPYIGHRYLKKEIGKKEVKLNSYRWPRLTTRWSTESVRSAADQMKAM
jgi:hypothetical protein